VILRCERGPVACDRLLEVPGPDHLEPAMGSEREGRFMRAHLEIWFSTDMKPLEPMREAIVFSQQAPTPCEL
jgi:hypothetical protein